MINHVVAWSLNFFAEELQMSIFAHVWKCPVFNVILNELIMKKNSSDK